MGKGFELVQRMSKASVEGQWENFAAAFTEDVRAWSPMYDLKGRDAFVATIRTQNAPFTDIETAVTLVCETNDVVVTESTWSIPHPSGVGRAVLPAMSAHWLRDGLICEIRQYWDNAGFADALAADRGQA